MRDIVLEKFIPIIGDFEQQGDDIVFNGKEIISFNSEKNIEETNPSFGKVLIPLTFDDGKFSATIEFKDVIKENRAFLMFNHNFENGKETFSCAGVSPNAPNYNLQNFDGEKWDFEVNFGMANNHSIQKYKIDMYKSGSEIVLFVNDVKIYTYNTKVSIRKSNIGFALWSYDEIRISNIDIEARKPKVFVVMEFSASYNSLYEEVIKLVCEEKFDLEVYRADEGRETGLIINDIIDKIKESTIVIADITPNNPNVFYEVGYAHAINKPSILMCNNNREKLPFDISGFRAIIYEDSIAGKSQVEKLLVEFLEKITGIQAK